MSDAMRSVGLSGPLSTDHRILALPARSLAMTSNSAIPRKSSYSLKESAFACGVLLSEAVVPPPVFVAMYSPPGHAESPRATRLTFVNHGKLNQDTQTLIDFDCPKMGQRVETMLSAWKCGGAPFG